MASSKTVREGGGECRACSPTMPGFRMLEHRPFRPFKTSEEYLYAMKEDLAEWLHTLYNLDINVDNFFEVLDPGVILCQHANKVNAMAAECRKNGVSCPKFPDWEVTYRTDVSHNAFHARDNVSNFIRWCRALGIMDCLLFETDDLVMRKNEKSFILCLLEVARRGSKVGMLAPLLVQMEEEIDRDIAKDQSKSGRGALEDRGTSPEPFFEETRVVDYGPMPQVTNNDLKSLDEMVRDLVNRCTCPTQFFMERISEGKYRIGDSKLLIYVRILRSHVMVRVGGGWDTLAHFLDKHDPCRCRQGHRTAIGAKLTVKFGQSNPAQTQMEVLYTRSPVSPVPQSTPSFVMPSSRQQQHQAPPPPPLPPPPYLTIPATTTQVASPPRQRRLSNSSSSASSCCSHKLSNGSLASLPGDGVAKPCNGHHLAHAEGSSPRNSTVIDASAQHSSGDSCCSELSDEGYKSGVLTTPEKSPLLSVSKISSGLPILQQKTNTDISRPSHFTRNSALDVTDSSSGRTFASSPSGDHRPLTSSPRPTTKSTSTTPKTLPAPKSRIPFGVSPLASPIQSPSKRATPPSTDQQRHSNWELANGVVRRRRLSGDHGTVGQFRTIPRSVSTYDGTQDSTEFTRNHPTRKSLQTHYKSMSMLPNDPMQDKYNTWSSSSKRSASRPTISMDTFINPKTLTNGSSAPTPANMTIKNRMMSVRSPKTSRKSTTSSPVGTLEPLIQEMIKKGVHVNKELYQKLMDTLVGSASKAKACPPEDNFSPDTSAKQSGMASPDSGSDVSFPNDDGVTKRPEDDSDNQLMPPLPQDNPKWTSSPRRHPDSKIPVLMELRRPSKGGGP